MWISETSFWPVSLSPPAVATFLSGFLLHSLIMKPICATGWAAPHHMSFVGRWKSNRYGVHRKKEHFFLGKKAEEQQFRKSPIPPALLQNHRSLHQQYPSLSPPGLGKPHAEEASAKEQNSHHIHISLPFCLCPFLAVPDLSPSSWPHIYEGHWPTRFNPWKTYSAAMPNHK